MSKVYDLTSKLSSEKPKIKIGDLELTVDNGYKKVFAAQEAISEQNERDAVIFTLKEFLGEEQYKKVEELDLNYEGIKTVFMGVLAAATGEDLEEFIKRFQ